MTTDDDIVLTLALIRETNKQLAYEFINERLSAEALTAANVDKLALLFEEIEAIQPEQH